MNGSFAEGKSSNPGWQIRISAYAFGHQMDGSENFWSLCESQFRQAKGLIGRTVIDARSHMGKLAFELPRTENRRWRVTFFDPTSSQREIPA